MDGWWFVAQFSTCWRSQIGVRSAVADCNVWTKKVSPPPLTRFQAGYISDECVTSTINPVQDEPTRHTCSGVLSWGEVDEDRTEWIRLCSGSRLLIDWVSFCLLLEYSHMSQLVSSNYTPSDFALHTHTVSSQNSSRSPTMLSVSFSAVWNQDVVLMCCCFPILR